MTYEAWRCTFQSAEQAARSAYSRVEELARRVAELEAERAERGREKPVAWLDKSTDERPGDTVWLPGDLKGMDTSWLVPLYAAPTVTAPVASETVNKAWADGKAEGHGDATEEASVVIGGLRARLAELEAELFAWRDKYMFQAGQFDSLKEVATKLAAERAEREGQKPDFWYRPHSDGQDYDGPIHDSQIEPVRRESGAWVPLYAGPLPSQSAAALVGLRGCNSRHGGAREPDPCIYRMRTTDPGCTGCAERDEDQPAEAGGSIQGEPQ